MLQNYFIYSEIDNTMPVNELEFNLFKIVYFYIVLAGACAATKESIEWNLTKEGTGNALVLVVGGAAEVLDAHPGQVKLILKKRKGFIKLALKHG